MTKKIVASDLIKHKKYNTKSASGFIENYVADGVIVPQTIRIDDETALSFYKGNEWVNAVVNRIVLDSVKHKPQVTLRDRSMKVKPMHERQIKMVEEFLFDPNENNESFREIRQKFLKDLLVVGRGAIEKVLDKKTRILLELYTVIAKDIQMISDKHGNLKRKAYKLTPPHQRNGETIYYTRDELIHTVYRPTTMSVYGEKPLDTLASAVASDIIRAAYNSNFFMNGAESSGIISLEGMSKRQLKDFNQYWKSSHKGYSNAHKMSAVNVPVKYVKMAMNNRDMQFVEYGQELKQKIYAVFAMQPFIMGDITSTTGKLNSAQQKEVYMDGAIKPLLEMEAYVYTKEILHQGFGFTNLEITFPGADSSDIETQAKMDRDDITTGVITINEVRARRKLSPVAWGDAPIVMPGGKLVNPDTGQLMDPPSASDNNSSKPKEPKPKDDKTADLLNAIYKIMHDGYSSSTMVEMLKRKIKGNSNIRQTVSVEIENEIKQALLDSGCDGADKVKENLKNVVKNSEVFLK